MTDLVERLRERGFWSDGGKVWDQDALCAAAAAALEAKDKELAALREELAEAKADVLILHNEKMAVLDRVFSAAGSNAALHERVKEMEEGGKIVLDIGRRWKARAETAERERYKLITDLADMKGRAISAERELETMNKNHRVMAKLLADTGCERDEARAALKPFADVGAQLPITWRDHETHWSDIFQVSIGDMRRAARAITGEKA